MVSRIARRLWLALTMGCCLFAGPALAVDGALLFQASSGRMAETPVSLQLTPSWQGPIGLTMGQVTLSTTAYAYGLPEANGVPVLAMAFRQLPNEHPYTMLLLKGRYVAGKKYYGEMFIRYLTEDETSDGLRNLVRGTLGDTHLEGYQHVGTFYFAAKAPNVIFRADRGAGPNNPCPDGPCWSTGGVGRYGDYYPGGPIQNPGHASQPATFNEGVPSDMTREGQFAAQRVGVERAAEIYDQINAYTYFPWAYALPVWWWWWG